MFINDEGNVSEWGRGFGCRTPCTVSNTRPRMAHTPRANQSPSMASTPAPSHSSTCACTVVFRRWVWIPTLCLGQRLPVHAWP